MTEPKHFCANSLNKPGNSHRETKSPIRITLGSSRNNERWTRWIIANNTGVLAPEAVTAFEQLGMPKTANMLRASIQFFGTLYPRDRVIREQRIPRAVWIRCYSATGIGRLHGGRNRRRKRWLLACRKQLCARALTRRLLCPKASCLS